jgi:hypothetical protein
MNIARFILTPVAVLTVFFITALFSYDIARTFGIWPDVFVGPVCAASVLVVGFVVAPRRKISTASFIFLVGSYTAWFQFRGYFPEGGPKAYELTKIPAIASISTGLLVLGVLILYTRSNHLPNKAPEPTARGVHRSAGAVRVIVRRWLSHLR